MINAISHPLNVPNHSVSFPPTARLSSSIQDKLLQVPPSTSRSNGSKETIAINFGRAAHIYDVQAHLQRQCAHQLLSFLDETCRRDGTDLPDGPILEIGCGTGFITQHLINRFLSKSLTPQHQPRKHSLLITDLSAKMVEFCQHHVTLPDGLIEALGRSPLAEPCESPSTSYANSNAPIDALRLSPNTFYANAPAQRPNAPTPQRPNAPTPQLTFHILDAETSIAPSQTYSLIIGGFVAQWFKHIADTVKQLLAQLKPGGRLVLSFPGHQSFPEWREWCDRLNLPYTAHPLPNPHTLIQHLQLSPHQYELRVEMYPTYYDSAKAFFKSMKVIGAGASDAVQRLSPQQMRQLLRVWKPSAVSENTVTPPFIKVQYEVVYLSILKE